MTTTVGRFTYEDGVVTGPAEYMKSSQYADLIRSIENGSNHTFRFAATDPQGSPDVETALLVTIQTDFAGWHGMKTFNASRGV